jgi:hypothetical protein
MYDDDLAPLPALRAPLDRFAMPDVRHLRADG